ncbi:S-layer homology domain-containing protein [Nitriliruptoraceae bacterium ZYF776]|nr:S-layer homology domain-containing protein [Profundirhabdus halotolerans]
MTAGPTPRPGRNPVTTSRRRTVLLVAVLALLVVAIPAAANHAFRDVPSSYVHHNAIGDVADAGITAGCRDGREYCPNDDVTRGQMASFLARSGSRVAHDASATTLTAGSGNVNGVPVTVTASGPGASGTQNIVLQGSVTVSFSGDLADCPCEVEAYVYRARGNLTGPSSFATLPAEAAGNGTVNVSLPVDWSTPIAANRTEEFRIAVFVDGTTRSGLRADGSLTAVTAPFGG